jgi:hypothetical protein
MPQSLDLNREVGTLIFTIRGERVILDAHLATLYGVPTKALNQAVHRNLGRFPEEFMFQLTKEEAQQVRSQFVTLPGGHFRYLPRVFTEHGALMVANILQSPQAVTMSITIVKAFVKLRRMALTIEELARKVGTLERGFRQHGEHFQAVFDALRQLMTPPPEKPKPRIGFHSKD